MAIDATKFLCYAQLKTAGVVGAQKAVVSMEEGVTCTERSRATTDEASVPTSGDYVEYTLPMPPDNILLAGTYQMSYRAKRATTTVTMEVDVVVDGSTTFASSASTSITATSYATYTCDIVVASDTPIQSTLVARVMPDDASGTGEYIQLVHAEIFFGVKSGEVGCARNAMVLTALTPSPAVHASPTTIDGPPYVNLEAVNVYATDTIELSKWTDTLSTAAHSASGESTQSIGTVSSITDSLPALSTRRIDMQADATRRPDTLTNTYYVIEVLSGATVMGTIVFETRSSVEQPTLTSLNGTVGTPVVTVDPAPELTWTHPNAAATHYRVKIYDASDDSLDIDSGELTGAALQGSYVMSGASLTNGKTYYAILTVMCGSGGSTWTVNSARGYFTIDWASTAVKITSHEGSSDTPQVITTLTPTIEWEFSKVQTAYNLAVVDTANDSVVYETGWVVTATKSAAIPASKESIL